MDEIWAVSARYCVRQNSHAFIWLWALFLGLVSAAFLVARKRRFAAAVLSLLALAGMAFGLVLFSACTLSAPSSMGLGAYGNLAAHITTLTCLSHEASTFASLWTIAALSCSAALGSYLWARSPSTTPALRAARYLGAALLVLPVVAAGFVSWFDLSWCSSSRLF